MFQTCRSPVADLTTFPLRPHRWSVYRTGDGIQGSGDATPFFTHPIEEGTPASEDLRQRL